MESQKRQEIRKELTEKGYSWSYVDNWPPKVDMWWHRDWLNEEGRVVREAGALVPNQPGHPDHQTRLSRRGLLPWPPGEGCRCKGCRERSAAPVFMPPPENGTNKSHSHSYRGRKVGAPCRFEGCDATRLAAAVSRKKKAAVTMAEAAV